MYKHKTMLFGLFGWVVPGLVVAVFSPKLGFLAFCLVTFANIMGRIEGNREKSRGLQNCIYNMLDDIKEFDQKLTTTGRYTVDSLTDPQSVIFANGRFVRIVEAVATGYAAGYAPGEFGVRHHLEIGWAVSPLTEDAAPSA